MSTFANFYSLTQIHHFFESAS